MKLHPRPWGGCDRGLCLFSHLRKGRLLQLFHYKVADFLGKLRVLLKGDFGIIAALSHTLLAIVEPSTAALENANLNAQVNDFTHTGNTLTVHNIELCLFKGRCYLILNNAGAGAVTDNGGAVFDCLLLTDVNTNAGIETEGATAGCNLGIAVDNANLFTKLIDKYCNTVCLRKSAC